MNELIWRKANENDLDQILKTQALPENCAFIMENSKSDYEGFIANEAFDFMIFQNPTSQKEIGFCLLNREDLETMELKRLIIYQKGMGFGSLALEQICTYGFEELSVSKIWLDVFSNNLAAIRLYEKMKFIKVIAKTQILLHQGVRKELIVMELCRK